MTKWRRFLQFKCHGDRGQVSKYTGLFCSDRCLDFGKPSNCDQQCDGEGNSYGLVLINPAAHTWLRWWLSVLSVSCQVHLVPEWSSSWPQSEPTSTLTPLACRIQFQEHYTRHWYGLLHDNTLRQYFIFSGLSGPWSSRVSSYIGAYFFLISNEGTQWTARAQTIQGWEHMNGNEEE